MEITDRSSCKYAGFNESLRKYFVRSIFCLLKYPELKKILIQEKFYSFDEVNLQMLNYFICMDLL